MSQDFCDSKREYHNIVNKGICRGKRWRFNHINHNTLSLYKNSEIAVAQNRNGGKVSIISLLHHLAVKTARNPITSTTKTSLRASIPSSLIRADDCWSLWAFIAASAAAGLQLEQKTSVGKALSGPVCSMLLSVLATNIGILPIAGSPYISQLQSFVVKVATPLLLLGADVRKIFKDTKGLVNAFLVGTIGTLLGSVLSFSVCHSLLDSVGLPGDGWKLAAALTAKVRSHTENCILYAYARWCMYVCIGSSMSRDCIRNIVSCTICMHLVCINYANNIVSMYVFVCIKYVCMHECTELYMYAYARWCACFFNMCVCMHVCTYL